MISICNVNHAVNKKPVFCSNLDTAVNGISIDDSKSAVKILKHIPKAFEGDNDSLPNVILYNINKTERLILYQHPGGSTNEFFEFYLEYINKDASKGHPDNSASTQFANFKTNMGIQLGTKTSVILGLFKNCIKINNQKHVLSIAINDLDKSDFLMRYYMPSYYANYYFDKNKKVNKISFGFPYP